MQPSKTLNAVFGHIFVLVINEGAIGMVGAFGIFFGRRCVLLQ